MVLGAPEGPQSLPMPLPEWLVPGICIGKDSVACNFGGLIG